MFKFFTRRYSLLKFRTFRWLFVFTGPILVFIYILAKKPFGFRLFPISEQIQLALFFSIPVMFIWIAHLFWLQSVIIKKLNILNTFLWLTWIHFFISCYYYTFSELYIFGGQFDFYWFPMTLNYTMVLGVFITSIMVVMHGGYLIRKRLQRKSEDQVAHFLE
jgi:hypothetical protein